MAKFVKKFLDWAIERNFKTSEVGRVDGITLIDVRERGGSFKTTIESSLHLIRQYDPRRYARVKRYISRIVNVITPVSGYNLKTRTVHFEFREMTKFTDEERVAIYASLLVDKATRGALQCARAARRRSRRIADQDGIREARRLVTEHNRFLEKIVDADLLPFPTFKSLRMEFDEKHPSKTSGKKKNFLKMLFLIAWRATMERKIKKK
jgi:hypothetical protein